MVKIWKRYLRSNFPSPSSPSEFACFIAICIPEKHDANTIPVRSLCTEGTCQFRINRRPPLPICSSGVSGIPASRSARRPAPIASWVVISQAITSFGSTPNSSAKSKAALTPAS